MNIVQASPSRLGELQALERAAAARFRDSPHPAAADMPPLDVSELERVLALGGLWVVDKDGVAVAFIAWEPIGDDAYIIELDVHPAAAGARLGAALIDHVAQLAAAQRLSRVLLRTFIDVPWNAPYYARLGFVALDGAPAHLDDVVRHESAAGLDLSRRLTMARSI